MNYIEPLNQSLPSAVLLKTEEGNNSSGQDGEEFSSVLNKAVTRNLEENVIADLNKAGSYIPGDSLGYMQSMLLNEAQNGEVTGNEMLIFLLMSMMQEFKNSDLTPLISAMTALMPSQNSGAVPYMPPSLPNQSWLPNTLPSVTNTGNRSPQTLNRLISQFKVESNERYRPNRNGNTYCNIFVWDVTRALGCEIPHYIDKESGDPRYYPNVKNAYELDANGVCDWLIRRGEDQGWRMVTAAEAQKYANAGYPVVSAWQNKSGGAGHVQIVCPSKDGEYNQSLGVTVAQAGIRNYSYAHIKETMSVDKIPQTRYYVHA
ncbi:MAG: hypothetical protein FWG61_07195 [Firmicutes bacterium]|nr:hypothetical protein [Bacillota bacterium]